MDEPKTNQNNLQNGQQMNQPQQVNQPQQMNQPQQVNMSQQNPNATMQNPGANPYDPKFQNQNVGTGNVVDPMQFKQATSKKKENNKTIILVIAIVLVVVILGIVIIGLKNVFDNNSSTGKSGKKNGNTGDTNSTNEVVSDADTLKIGQYVKYLPEGSSEYTLKKEISGTPDDQTISKDVISNWRIFNINNDGSVDLIAAIPTTSKVTLQGAIGYDNGVYLLNDICKNLYSNSSKNAVARSIRLSDISSKMDDTQLQIAGFKVQEFHRTYSRGDAFYPTIYKYENGSGVGKEIEYEEQEVTPEEMGNYLNATNNGRVTVNTNLGTTNDTNQVLTKTVEKVDVLQNGKSEEDECITKPIEASEDNKGYEISANQKLTVTLTAFTSIYATSYFTNGEYGEMLFQTGKSYWLATRYANSALNSAANFGIRNVEKKQLVINAMYNSNNTEYLLTNQLLPIVHITNFTKQSGTGTAIDPITF